MHDSKKFVCKYASSNVELPERTQLKETDVPSITKVNIFLVFNFFKNLKML